VSDVAVIIPAYNYARYLGQAIDSVLRQTHSEFEILVIDDGSTDGTRDLVHQYSDPRVHYIYQTNAGLSAARNTGLANAKSPFVAFLDADDEWQPDFLRTALGRFKALPEDYGIVATRSSRMDPTGKPIPTRNPPMPEDADLTARDITVKTRFMPSAVVARKSAFDQCGGFDTTLRSSEDRDMWIRIGQQFRIRLVRESLVLIRKHSSNMSKNAERMRVNKERTIAKAYEARVASHWNLPFWRRVWAIHHFQVGWTFADEGATGKAIAHMLRSILFWPFFLNPRTVNEPFLFRVRALRTFSKHLARRTEGASPKP